MLTSLFTGVSGLNANMTALSVIGNNIANVNTVGFKGSRASFADVLSQSLSGVSGTAQIGLGVTLSSVSPLFSQGAFETTKSGLDLAIDGDGFFVVRDSTGALFYSRAGQFNIDKDGYIINPEGYILRGYQADSAGNILSTIGDLQISSAAVPANATQNAGVVANLDSSSEIKGYVFTSGSNEDIRFSVNGGTSYITADLIADGGLQSGTAYTGDQVASAIKTALEAQNGTADTYTVTYDGSTGRFTIANDTGNSGTLVLDWSAALTTAETMLGFNAVSSGNIAAGSSETSDVAGGAFSVSKASETSNFSTSMTVYDSLGNDHQIAIYFRKDSTASSGNTWEWFAVVPQADSANSPTTDEIQAQGTLTFNTSGALTSESTITYPTVNGGFDFTGGATLGQVIAFDFGTGTTSGGTGLDGVTQYGSASAVFSQQQDGYASGTLQKLSIDFSGIITGVFSNGRTRSMGQVILADFPNASALSMMGKNLYAESTASGQPLSGAPNSAGRGTLHTNALELSTVDIAEEFVKMIAAQRGFQVNSKVITTSDEILNELVNIKR